MRLSAWLSALAILPTVACAQPAPKTCGAPLTLANDWKTNTPENVGIDGLRLCDIAQRLMDLDADVHSVLIVRHGRLVFEQYYPGLDAPWGKGEGTYSFDAITMHDMRSISKSVTSLLLGIAIDRKLIASINEPVLKFFPEYAELRSSGWEKVTLQHLISMSSGIAWDEARAWKDPKNDEPHLDSETDPLRYVFAKPIVSEPGTRWAYDGGGIELIAAVIARVAGKPLEQFAREELFDPLGITEWEWKSYRNGRTSAAAGLRLRPRDAAKIGQLMLSRGAWNGRQVVSTEWVAESSTPRHQAIGYFGGQMYYGYAWWMGRTLWDGKDLKWGAGVGLGGQRLFVIPDLDMVVMTNSGLYQSPRQGVGALDILTNIIVPAVRDKPGR